MTTVLRRQLSREATPVYEAEGSAAWRPEQSETCLYLSFVVAHEQMTSHKFVSCVFSLFHGRLATAVALRMWAEESTGYGRGSDPL